ncbi:MAG: hypothetical protein HRU12_09620 [Phaeodactylibacter sp.]|nr:hypothetical protein [Phaeodactylibacter sp.]
MNTDSQIQTTQLQDVDYDQMNGIRNTELSAAGKGYWYWKAYLNKDNDSKPALKDGRIAHFEASSLNVDTDEKTYRPSGFHEYKH